MVEFKAKISGFRIRKGVIGDSIKYIIYGDSQQEVDCFIDKYCKKKK